MGYNHNGISDGHEKDAPVITVYPSVDGRWMVVNERDLWVTAFMTRAAAVAYVNRNFPTDKWAVVDVAEATTIEAMAPGTPLAANDNTDVQPATPERKK